MELIELISIRIDEVRSQRGQDITELARRAGIKNKTLLFLIALFFRDPQDKSFGFHGVSFAP